MVNTHGNGQWRLPHYCSYPAIFVEISCQTVKRIVFRTQQYKIEQIQQAGCLSLSYRIIRMNRNLYQIYHNWRDAILNYSYVDVSSIGFPWCLDASWCIARWFFTVIFALSSRWFCCGSARACFLPCEIRIKRWSCLSASWQRTDVGNRWKSGALVAQLKHARHDHRPWDFHWKILEVW